MSLARLEAAEMRFLRSVKGYTRLGKSKKRSYKKRTGDLWNTRREIQTQTKLDQPSWKNGQHQTPEKRHQLRTSRKKRNDDNASMPEKVNRP